MTILYAILTFYFGYLFLLRFKLLPTQPFLRFGFTVFFGTYISTLIIFVLACLLSAITSGLLFKATLIYFAIAGAWIWYNRKYLKVSALTLGLSRKEALYIIVLLVLSYIFYSRFVTQTHDGVYVATIYWDFKYHIAMIENFVKGDNFIPQNESFSGVYHVYHYFWALIPAIYQSLGLNFAQGITAYSALFLATTIILGIGIAQQYVQKHSLLWLLPLFVLTHGSFKIIDYLVTFYQGWKHTTGYFQEWLPFQIDANIDFGYNGSMFNIFYFIVERQLLVACVALLVFITILLRTQRLPRKTLVLLGVLFGLFVQWHLYVMIMIVVICLSYGMLIWIWQRRFPENYWYLALPLLIVSGIYFMLLKQYALHSPYFDSHFVRNFPAFNPTFASMYPLYPASIAHFFVVYLYGYGPRLLLYVLAGYAMWRHDKKTALLYFSTMVIFVLVNTVQLSPLSIYDNHKWLKPFNLVIDIFSLIFLLKYFTRTSQQRIGLAILLVISSLAGVVSFWSFWIQQPRDLAYNLNDRTYQTFLKLPPRATILTDIPHLALASGHKVYISDAYAGQNLGLKTGPRLQIIKASYALRNKPELVCRFLISQKLINEIDYVIFSDTGLKLQTAKDCPIIEKQLQKQGL